MLKRKGFYGLILAIVVLTLFLPACFKLGGDPSIDAEFTLTRDISLMGISEFAFSVDVKGVKDAAVVEFDNGMPSVALSGGKAESRFFANIGTGEVTLSVRDSRGVELLKKTVTLEETKLTFDMAAVEDKSGIYVLIDDDLIFYSLECLEDMTFTEKVELLIEVILVNDSYVVIQSGDAWIWDFETYPNNPKYDLTQDTLDTLGLPNYALSICEGGFFNILNGKSLYLLEVEVDPEEGGEVEVDPDQILYEEGTEVTLTAVPASAQWLFGSWSGDLISTDPVETIVMDEDKVITANFYEAEDPYVGEPDEMVVCSGEEFSIVVPGDADEVEITFDGVTKAAVEDPEGLFTATFTAPSVAKDVTRAIIINAVKGPKEKSWTWEDKVTVKAEEIMVINEFKVEGFICGADETEIVVITCCFPEPDLETSFIAIEYSHSGEIEFLTDAEVTPLPGCEVELRYSWEFPRTECTDATVTAFIKSLCSEYVTETVVVEGIAVLDDEDVIEIGIDPLTIPCNATEVTFPVKINYSLDKLVEVFVDACRGEIISGSIATLLETGEETFTVDYSGLDCREACFAVNVEAEDCEGCPQEFEICYYFDLDNVKPEVGDFSLGLNPEEECDAATSTTVNWEVTDRALSEISIEVSDGKLVWWEGSVKKTGKVYHEYTAGSTSTGDITWEFDPWCGDLEITLTATDNCGERDLRCEGNCCDGLYKNTTVVSKKIFIDNIAPEIELIGIPDQICEGNILTFDWILEDCQLATATNIGATMSGFTTDATWAVLEPWIDGVSTGIATVTWEGIVPCGELVVELYGVDECGNEATETALVLVNTAEPVLYLGLEEPEQNALQVEILGKGFDEVLRICATDEVWIWYEASTCMEEMKMTVSRGCFDSKETPTCGLVIDCDEWIWEKEFDSECSPSYVVLKLPRMDCEELVVTLTGVDVCGRTVEASATYIVDNVTPEVDLYVPEIDKCSTETVIEWAVTDGCLLTLADIFETEYATEVVLLAITGNSTVTLDPESQAIWDFIFQINDTPADMLASLEGSSVFLDQVNMEEVDWWLIPVASTGYATWTFEELDCEEINVALLAADKCLNITMDIAYLSEDEIEELEDMKEELEEYVGMLFDFDVLFDAPIIVDNVGPRILEFGFVDEEGQPVDRSDIECDDVYTTDLLYLTWDATDNCPDDAILTVDLGIIEELVYDEVLEEWIWVDRGQEELVPWSSDGSKWRWNVEDQDCYYGTIALEVFDSCDSDSTETTILVDNIAPDFWFDASIEECSDATCVTITWYGYDRCMTCGTGDCGSWDIGKIYFSHPDVKTEKSFANIAIDTCVCTGPEYTGTVTWCFGNLDCETLVATIVGYDSAGNASDPWGMEIGNTDTVPPTITQFEISELMFDGDIPYVELTWEATDNCFDFVNIWVNQGSFQKPMVDVIETAAIPFVPPEPWTAFQKSKSWTKTVKWYLEDPAEEMKAWIAAYDICCNEATATVSREGFEFNLDVDWEGEGWAGDGGEGIPYGTVVELTADPTPCWFFVEWQITDRTGYSTSSENPLEYTITGDASIVAIFEIYSYDLTVSASPSDLGEVEYVSLDNPTNGECGKVATATAKKVECYDFLGWFEWDSDTGVATELTEEYVYVIDPISKDLNLLAWYEKVSYSLTIEASPSALFEKISLDDPTNGECSEVATATAQEVECYDFLGWFEWDSDTGVATELTEEYVYVIDPISKDLDLLAWFELKTVTVTYKVDPSGSGPASELTADGGTITRSNNTVVDYDCGHELTLRPRTNEGDTPFIRWEVETETGVDTYNTSQITIELTEDATITLFREAQENGN
jgi:hypothetical protein